MHQFTQTLQQLANRAMPHKPLKEYSRTELGIAILWVIATATVITSLAVAPGLGIIFKELEAHDRREKDRVRRRVYLLKKQSYMRKTGDTYTLTGQGHAALNEDAVWRLPAPQLSGKEKSWYLILFDIPVKQSRLRQALRDRLLELGCVSYQDSVYAHRRDLRKALDPFCEFYNLRAGVRYVAVAEIEGEPELATRFNEQQRRFAKKNKGGNRMLQTAPRG